MVTLQPQVDEAADAMELPSYEDLGEATDLSAVEANIAAAEASALDSQVADEDWQDDGDDEEEVEEEERTTDGLVDPSFKDMTMAIRNAGVRNAGETRRPAPSQNFWDDLEYSSDEGDESYAPEREEDDEDIDSGMRRFMEGTRWARRHQVWPSLMKVLQDPMVDDPHEPGLQAAALRFQDFRNQLSQESHQLRELDKLGRNMLHMALMRHRPDIVRAILSLQEQDEVMDVLTSPFEASGESDKDRIPCIHLALSGACHKTKAHQSLECLQLLLDQPVNLVPQVDNSGRSGLHVACAFGSVPAVELLLGHNADPGLQDDYGFMPLHYAIDSRNPECVKLMLQVSDRSAFSGELSPFYRCIDRSAWDAALLLHKHGWEMKEADISFLFDFAASRGLSKEWNFVAESFLAPEGVDNSAMEEVIWPEIFKEPNTVLVTHAHCGRHGLIPEETDDPQLRHELISQIPENPHRLEVLCGENGLLRTDLFRDLRWNTEPNMAPIVDVLRVHEFWYVQKLIDSVQKVRQLGRNRPMAIDRGDTKVTPDSWSAALHAAGAVLEAVDQVCNEQARNAFCAVRPPGHHLGPAGAVDKQDLLDDPEGSQGFCLLNNVAIGAAYAKCVYRHVIHKVAIIDFDVHHGNGTEATVRNLKYRPALEKEVTGTMPFAGSFVKLSVQKPPTCKPWLDGNDVENVFFASIHGFGGGFYPGSGGSCSDTTPRIINAPLKRGSGPAEFRRGMRRHILPQLQEFDPDFIFISAGFDGHEDDLIGCCNLSEEDYIWATQQLMAIANRCCSGRLVSVLEGGYNTRGEVLSPFASAVASHVRTLMYTSHNYSYLDCEVDAVTNMEDNETFIQRVEDLYISDNHNYVRREEARRLRQRKRSNFSNFAPFGTEMPPVKVQRQEDPSAEVLKEASAVEEQLADLDDASKEETEMKDEMKEEKLDVEKAEEAEREHAEAVAAAQEAMEAEVDAAEAEAAAAEAAAAAAQLAEENLEVEAEAHEESHEAAEAAADTFADEAMLQAVPEVAKTEGDEAREEKILEDCELVVEATDHLLQKVDAEEQPEEATWEGDV